MFNHWNKNRETTTIILDVSQKPQETDGNRADKGPMPPSSEAAGGAAAEAAAAEAAAAEGAAEKGETSDPPTQDRGEEQRAQRQDSSSSQRDLAQHEMIDGACGSLTSMTAKSGNADQKPRDSTDMPAQGSVTSSQNISVSAASSPPQGNEKLKNRVDIDNASSQQFITVDELKEMLHSAQVKASLLNTLLRDTVIHKVIGPKHSDTCQSEDLDLADKQQEHWKRTGARPKTTVRTNAENSVLNKKASPSQGAAHSSSASRGLTLHTITLGSREAAEPEKAGKSGKWSLRRSDTEDGNGSRRRITSQQVRHLVPPGPAITSPSARSKREMSSGSELGNTTGNGASARAQDGKPFKVTVQHYMEMVEGDVVTVAPKNPPADSDSADKKGEKGGETNPVLQAFVYETGDRLKCGCLVTEDHVLFLRRLLSCLIVNEESVEHFWGNRELYLRHDCPELSTLEMIREAKDTMEEDKFVTLGSDTSKELQRRAFLHRIKHIASPRNFLDVTRRDKNGFTRLTLNTSLLELDHVGLRGSTPFEIFRQHYLHKKVLTDLCVECNAYAKKHYEERRFRRWFPVDEEEMQIFILQMIMLSAYGAPRVSGHPRKPERRPSEPERPYDTESAGGARPKEKVSSESDDEYIRVRVRYCISRARFREIASSWRVFDVQRRSDSKKGVLSTVDHMFKTGNQVWRAPTLLSATSVRVPYCPLPVRPEEDATHQEGHQPFQPQYSVSALVDSKLFVHGVFITLHDGEERHSSVLKDLLDLHLGRITSGSTTIEGQRIGHVLYIDGMSMEQVEELVNKRYCFVASVTPDKDRWLKFPEICSKLRGYSSMDGRTRAISYGKDIKTHMFWHDDAPEERRLIASNVHTLDEQGCAEAARLVKDTNKRLMKMFPSMLNRLIKAHVPFLRYYHIQFLQAVALMMHNSIVVQAVALDITDFDRTSREFKNYVDTGMEQLLKDIAKFLARQPLRMSALEDRQRRRVVTVESEDDEEKSANMADALAEMARHQKVLMEKTLN